MSHSTATNLNPKPNPNPNPNSNNNKPPPPSKRPRPLSLPDILLRDQDLKHTLRKMRFQSFAATPSSIENNLTKFQSLTIDPNGPDYTSLLSDELLLEIFSKLPISQHLSNSLVCKRWLSLHGRLVRSLKLTDWSFIDTGRVFTRFPNLMEVNVVGACIRSSKNSGILVSHKSLSVPMDTQLPPKNGFIDQNEDILPPHSVDRLLELLAKKYPNLRRIVAIGASEKGLLSIAEECHTLQGLELHYCGDLSLKGISRFQNLQVVKLIGSISGFYNSVVSDIGLTILAQGCRRLVKLELSGCEGSYDGIKAIGQCCQMLEELTLCDHKLDGGWLAALSFCGNLKILKLQLCKGIDSSPGSHQHLGSCLAIEELQMHRCQLRDKKSLEALFLVCENVSEIVFKNCWGLEDDVFGLATICRRVKILSLKGCSLLTTGGLESVIISWKELQRLKVVSCNNIKDSEITPDLASLFSVLKELKWRPDSRSLLSAGVAGTGVGKKGARFFQGFIGLPGT